MAEREVSHVGKMVIWAEVSTFADRMPACGNWVWT